AALVLGLRDLLFRRRQSRGLSRRRGGVAARGATRLVSRADARNDGLGDSVVFRRRVAGILGLVFRLAAPLRRRRRHRHGGGGAGGAGACPARAARHRERRDFAGLGAGVAISGTLVPLLL